MKSPRKKYYWYEKLPIPIKYSKSDEEIEDNTEGRPRPNKKYPSLWAMSRLLKILAWLALIGFPFGLMIFPSWLILEISPSLPAPAIALLGFFIGLIIGCVFWINFYVAAEWIELHIDRNRMLVRLIQLNQ